ncbi:MAG TPA: aminoglycoside phosphotransferase family protein [Humibacter sp.]|nr:aminoglycoside phosphotransferase family protein [Humibacter sp.]
MTEVPLTGGNVTPVSRRGDTVLREGGPWTQTVHAVLRHARSSGMAGIPEPLGTSADGREIVSYLVGHVPVYPMPSWVWRDDVLVQAARMLRAWHDSTAGFSPVNAVWRLPSHDPAEVVCHNDFAQYNLVFDLEGDEPELTGVIDFDTMSPGPRVLDIAYLAYRLVPYLDEPDTPEVPEGQERMRRLALLLETYGGTATQEEVFAAMVAKLRELADFTDERAVETGRSDLVEHAVMYREHAAKISAAGA